MNMKINLVMYPLLLSLIFCAKKEIKESSSLDMNSEVKLNSVYRNVSLKKSELTNLNGLYLNEEDQEFDNPLFFVNESNQLTGEVASDDKVTFKHHPELKSLDKSQTEGKKIGTIVNLSELKVGKVYSIEKSNFTRKYKVFFRPKKIGQKPVFDISVHELSFL